MLAPGDSIVLLERRLRGDVERRALLANLDASDPGEHVLIARFERDEAAAIDAPLTPHHRARPGHALVGLAASIAFLIAIVFTR